MAGGIVIVGASLGGLRAAEQLRAAGWEGPVTVIGEEEYRPYNRPPLSKDVLAGSGTVEEVLAGLLFRSRRGTEDITWRLQTAVSGADLARRTLTTTAGESIPYTGLVAATGLRPARLGLDSPTAGRHWIRTLKDAMELRSELVPGTRVVVVGAGFIGCETAASAAGLGCTVTLVEGCTSPLEKPLGAALAAGIRRMLADLGIACLAGARVAAYQGESRCTGVVLDDGTRLPADVIVEAVGSKPNVQWLAGNGLDTSDGILCDSSMRAIGEDGAALPEVVAVGDVARFPDRLFGGPTRRIEHWATPTDTAKIAAPALLAGLSGRKPVLRPAPLPSFWTDLAGTRIQGLGSPGLADEIRVLEGDPTYPEAGVAVAYARFGRLVGAVTAGLPAQKLLNLRREILDHSNLVSA